MTDFVELVIPIDREWLTVLKTIVLPITKLLSNEAQYFFTNDENKILRLRIEEEYFLDSKNEIYSLLLRELQSSEKVKIYKQHYFLEETRFGKFQNTTIHTDMFSAASKVMIQLLEEAEGVESYENRLPYAVIAVHYIFIALEAQEVQDLEQLYIQHWMCFNEQETIQELMQSYQETYSEEGQSLGSLLDNIDQNDALKNLFSEWKNACTNYVQLLKDPAVLEGISHRYKTYFYTNNQLNQARKWEVVADHIHLLFNRFGINNEDETLIVYLTQSAMKSA